MNDQHTQSTLAQSMKRALEAKRSSTVHGTGANGMDAKTHEKRLQREAAAMNKPAFKRMSKRG